MKYEGNGLKVTGIFNAMQTTKKTTKAGKPYEQNIVYLTTPMESGRCPEFAFQTFKPELFSTLKKGEQITVPLTVETSQNSPSVFYKHWG